ncbi:hypothetical protein C8Q76DRAFT_691972 [Earliella scabrosa]|nr:hypothetical protein C8Q76DRAFT_691972 [Earliella scabrosa]
MSAREATRSNAARARHRRIQTRSQVYHPPPDPAPSSLNEEPNDYFSYQPTSAASSLPVKQTQPEPTPRDYWKNLGATLIPPSVDDPVANLGHQLSISTLISDSSLPNYSPSTTKIDDVPADSMAIDLQSSPSQTTSPAFMSFSSATQPHSETVDTPWTTQYTTLLNATTLPSYTEFSSTSCSIPSTGTYSAPSTHCQSSVIKFATPTPTNLRRKRRPVSASSGSNPTVKYITIDR